MKGLFHIGRTALSRLALPLLAGLAGALAALAYRLVLEFGSKLLWGGDGDVVSRAIQLPWFYRLLLPAAGGMLAGCLLDQVRRRYPSQHGDYMAVLAEGGYRLGAGNSLWRAASAAVSLISGCAIGREGAMIQLAALAGSRLSLWLSLDARRASQMLGCAAAAGVALAYQAPVAAALFIAEIVYRRLAWRLLLPLLLACSVPGVLIVLLPGPAILYALPRQSMLSVGQLLLLLPLALLCGVFWPCMLAGLNAAGRLFRPLHSAMARLALGGLACGVLALLSPYVLGNGSSDISHALHANWPFQLVLLVLLSKWLAISLASGAGTQGGLFTPTLCLGAMLGGLYVLLANQMGANLPLHIGMVSGMAALLAAALRAPLTAWMMLLEMTGDFTLLLPLGLLVLLTYQLSCWLNYPSLYSPALHSLRSNQSSAARQVRSAA